MFKGEVCNLIIIIIIIGFPNPPAILFALLCLPFFSQTGNPAPNSCHLLIQNLTWRTAQTKQCFQSITGLVFTLFEEVSLQMPDF